MQNKTLQFLFFLFILIGTLTVKAEDGHRLWLRYDRLENDSLRNRYRSQVTGIISEGSSETMKAALTELQTALGNFLSVPVYGIDKPEHGSLIIGTPSSSPMVQSLTSDSVLDDLGNEGYRIFRARFKDKKVLVIAGNTDIAVLYGSFHLIRIMSMQGNLDEISIKSRPKTNLRILDHWDNLDRTIERGYAGFSLWEWHLLPDYISPVYKEYARANASIGINGAVLTNVNANALVLTPQYLAKVAALADVFRPYGIKVYLTARFNAPMELGHLSTADPLNTEVIAWWRSKMKEIYQFIPDFGGFLVKANSEGQPGPQNYGRSHAEGANMLASAIKPFGGIIMWRAFVYDNNTPVDRAKQAYNEFYPLDGKFMDNVLVQVKNGAIDFQPREPFHPLFGAMKNTPLMIEFQITQEYLGFATHLVYLAPLFKECLESDTWIQGKGSTVARFIDGSIYRQTLTGMAGVANIGNDRNWTGHPMAQSNWYAFGRLAWDPYLGSETIAEEWIRMTFSNKVSDIQVIKTIMLASREITVNYMTPVGLHHLMGKDHHYGPGPWVNEGRADWTSVYYHKADSLGIGFNRTASGSNATAQYAQPVADVFNDPAKCPEKYLLWFHHLPWNYPMKSGRTLWDEICYKYSAGVDSVVWMQNEWQKVKGSLDEERFTHVNNLLNVQLKEAKLWRDACISYFQTFSKKPIPVELEKPQQPVEYYKSLKYYYVPGI